TNTESEFGTQYDSLSDMVAFGVAPALLMFSWVLSGMGNFGWMAGFLYMACAALRLARFNTQPDNTSFTGLASPAAAGVMAATVWVWFDNQMGTPGFEMAVLFTLQTAVVGLLMVSNITYYSPKGINLKGRVPFRILLGIVILLTVIVINPAGVLLVLVGTYCLWGPVKALMRKLGLSKKVDASEVD
ncbi:MAG: CDP-diacylglycerol--serine O-phosphatidyltransferase, partial [Gammaproteobacteria bacterium]|nr:CDP-diacylglycerol--serine O-phosphatidyltransferase [Gammaproteobacteria bacterium]